MLHVNMGNKYLLNGKWWQWKNYIFLVIFLGDDTCEMNPCANNGRCEDLASGFVCRCKPGYQGEFCELGEER